MSASASTIIVGDKNVELPIKTGKIGPDVVDIGKLYAQTQKGFRTAPRTGHAAPPARD